MRQLVDAPHTEAVEVLASRVVGLPNKPVIRAAVMDAVPPETPMTPSAEPHSGQEAPTTSGNTPSVTSSLYTASVSKPPVKVSKKLQRAAWNRYWKKDRFQATAGVKDADCKRYLELSRREKSSLSYDEEDELEALQKSLHAVGAQAVRPERTMQPWEARLRRISSLESAPPPRVRIQKAKKVVGRPKSGEDNSRTAKRLKDVRRREKRELERHEDDDDTQGTRVSHAGDVRAKMENTRMALPHTQSIAEGAAIVAPPVESVHPAGLPPKHLLVPVRNHNPPEWVKATRSGDNESLDTASLTTAGTTATAKTPSKTPSKKPATPVGTPPLPEIKSPLCAAVSTFKAVGKQRSRRRGWWQAVTRIRQSRDDLIDLNPEHIVDLLKNTSLEELRAAESAPYREDARAEIVAALQECKRCRKLLELCPVCQKCVNGWLRRNRWALETVEKEVAIETKHVLKWAERPSLMDEPQRSINDSPPNEVDTERKKIAQMIHKEQQAEFKWLDDYGLKRETTKARDAPMANRFDSKDQRIVIPAPVGPTGLVIKKIPLEGQAVHTKVDELSAWDDHLEEGRAGPPVEWPNHWRKTKKELAQEAAARENLESRSRASSPSRSTRGAPAEGGFFGGTRVSFEGD